MVADGKTIQVYLNGVWNDLDTIYLSSSVESYRIKPEPKITETFFNVYIDGSVDVRRHRTFESANEYSNGSLYQRTGYIHIVFHDDEMVSQEFVKI